jgi:polar amino acid transport system substrate-binding protein
MVPASIKSSGKLTVATGAGYPPFEFYATDNKTIIGFDPDLISAVAGVLGLKSQLADLKFDSIIPGLQSQRYDVGDAAMSVTPERLKVVDFVSYFKGGTSLMVKTGNPLNLSLSTMCGHTIAVEKGTIYSDDYLPAFSKTCTSDGKKAINVGVYPDQPGATLAVSSGRADATMSDYGPLTYIAKQTKQTFQVLNINYKSAPYGIALPKGSKLAPAIQGALKKLIADGTYKKIVDKWGLSAGAINDPVVSTHG